MNRTTDLAILAERPDLFEWGVIQEIYKVGRYTVIKAEEWQILSFPREMRFHAYVDGKPVSSACHSLERALVEAMAFGAFSDGTAIHVANAASRVLTV